MRRPLLKRDLHRARLNLEALERRLMLSVVPASLADDDLTVVHLDDAVDAIELLEPATFVLDEAAAAIEGPYVPGEILVKLREVASSSLEPWSLQASSPMASTPSELALSTVGPLLPLDYLMGQHGVTSVRQVFTNAKNKSLITGADDLTAASSPSDPSDPERPDLSLWYQLNVSPDVDLATAIAAFGAAAEVQVAEPNYEWRPAVLPDGTTDPDIDDQWHLINANIPVSWQFLEDNGVHPGGRRDVVVAVIDTGVDYTHQDLAGNMWINGGEIPGNGIDDDGNGFVDDIHGASVVSDARSESGDPIDLHGHGTHVAGIIAAQAYNGVGGVGVAFNTQIMAVRAAQSSGVLTTQDISEGILYAVDNGADVINMSFGGYQRSQIVEDALAVAFSQASLIAAAGNDRRTADVAPFYPAALPWVIGVMASTRIGTIASFSNFDSLPNTSREYEVAAPGVGIYSTLPGNKYAAWSGTSMAAPVISGVASLLRSFYFDPAVYSSRFIMGQITGTAKDEKGAKPGEDAPTGDSYAALTEAPIPGVKMLENWLFDDITVDAGNDGDGRIDSGETVHIGIELQNDSGQADVVTSTLRARALGAVFDDPFVTFGVETVEYGTIGPFNSKGNGFVRNQAGALIGVSAPFVVTLDPNTPNDHVIPFELTTTFRNGLDPDDPVLYSHVDRFEYVVQRGRNVPTVISQDMALTNDQFWIVGGPVLVEAGATLTISEGTQVQWGAISDDPFNPGPKNGSILVRGSLLVEGTQDQPVNLFPSPLVSG